MADTAQAFLLYQLEQHALLEEALDALQPQGRAISCLSIGGTDSAALLLAAMRGRLSRIADISKDFESSLLLRRDVLQRALPPDVEVRSLAADLFDDKAFSILRGPDERSERFDAVFVHKTLHHLRENRCRFADSLPEHPGADHTCIGALDPAAILERLWKLGRSLVFSESYVLGEDPDKQGAQGGMLSLDELEAFLLAASALGRIEVLRPMRLSLSPGRGRALRDGLLPLFARLRMVDYVLFAVAEPSQAEGRRARRR
jgi:hypothetical protein